MLTRQRHHEILNLLDRRGAVTAAELADAFGVSGVTIRRDLIDLHGRGLLHRVHGGAVRAEVREGDHRPDSARRTNSGPVAAAASRTTAQPALMFIGGEATRRGAHVGPLAHAAIRSLHIQTLYLDVHGLHPDTGFTAEDLSEADIDAALVRSAQRVVVLAHHRAWGRVGIRTIAPLDRADVLICDDGLPVAARRAVAGRVGQLLIAAPA